MVNYKKLRTGIKKYQTPAGSIDRAMGPVDLAKMEAKRRGMPLNYIDMITENNAEDYLAGFSAVNAASNVGAPSERQVQRMQQAIHKELRNRDKEWRTLEDTENNFGENFKKNLNSIGQSISGVDFSENASWRNAGLSEGDAMGMGIASQAVQMGVSALDGALMGDKNFGALSEAIDTAVHGVSSALMKSGNPYAMASGAALEGINFLSKAGGLTVLGFDVNISSSGYGDLGHKESKSNRSFFGLETIGNKLDKQLQSRNEQAQMALKASNVSDTIKFEQEARMNSVDDVILANKIALAGGVDTSLLSAKHGAILQRLKNHTLSQIKKAKEGAKLKKVKVSEEESILPTGTLHKNKHNIDLEHITEKGLPVITVDDDTVETLEEIKLHEDSITLHAEVESLEIIFSKELTDFIEERRKQWHESNEKDNKILLDVGLRITKEILLNTKDEEQLINKIEEKENGGTV